MLPRFLLLIAILASFISGPVQAFETRAHAAWVFDMATGTVLMDKNADQPLPPASMSKLMTLNMLFEALRDGRVTLDTPFTVSARARAMTGSTMFLNERDRPTARELIQGVIVNSGNDACVVIAEGLAGTEDAFAEQMTARAKALGMTNSHFANASGWPDPGQLMSMRDLGILARRLITEFPEHYHVFSQAEFNFDNRAPANRHNRNPLLKIGNGADGMKTGHTEEAGYGLVGSAKQGDRRIILVLSGMASEQERAQEGERIMNWAFRQFVLKTVIKAGQRIAEAEVWLGAQKSVGLVAARDVSMLVPALVQDGLNAKVVYTGPLTAPLAAGAQVAKLVITVPELPDQTIPLMTEKAVPAAGFVRRLTKAAEVLLSQLMGDPKAAS